MLDDPIANVRLSDRPLTIRQLDHNELDALSELETASWPQALRASKAVMQQRFDLGHGCWVAESDDVLVAAGNYVYTSVDPNHRQAFPTSFTAFYQTPRSAPVVTSLVYNLCVRPGWRGCPAVFNVMETLVSQARLAGARYLVGNARCPSFNGSPQGPDQIGAKPAFRKTVLNWHRTGRRPDDTQLGQDPLLRFYKRTLSCEFRHLMPGFLPGDRASGGYGVIFVKNLVALDG